MKTYFDGDPIELTCEVGDLSNARALSFEFGGEEDRPVWLEADAAVTLAPAMQARNHAATR